MEPTKVDELKQTFKDKGWVKLAFLFGSQIRGKTMSESDFDIGVWPEENTQENNINQLWLELERTLKKSVDLVILPQARPTIAWEALRGIPLKISDEHFYINKMLEVSQEAEDFQDLVMEIWEAREKGLKS